MRPTLMILGILSLTAALIAGASESPGRHPSPQTCRATGWAIDCGPLSGLLASAASVDTVP